MVLFAGMRNVRSTTTRARLTATLVFATLLTGCLGLPELPDAGLAKGSKVGYFLKVEDKPGHTHIGTTIFTNFDRVSEHDWSLDERVVDLIPSGLATSGYEMVNLAEAGFAPEEVFGLVVAQDGKWRIQAGRESVVERLRALDIRAVVVVAEGPVLAELNCGAYGCTEFYAQRAGMYTRSVFGFDWYFAVAAYNWGVYTMDPPGNFAAHEAVRETTFKPVLELEDYPTPKNYEVLSAEEYVPVAAGVEELVKRTTLEIARVLGGGT